MRLFFLILLILLISSAPPVMAEPLQGGVSEDVIQPAPERFRPGQIFNEKALEGERADNWVPIPTWVAGRWTREFEVIEFPNGKQETKQVTSSTTWGAQTDAKGCVWHCFPMPAVGMGVGGGEKCYSIWLNQVYDPPRVEYMRYSGEGVSITVDARTNVIKQVVQSKAVKTVTPNRDGTITSSSVEGVYDEFGKRQVMFKGHTVYHKTGNYAPRGDLMSSFVHHLQSQGLNDRIPASAQSLVPATN